VIAALLGFWTPIIVGALIGHFGMKIVSGAYRLAMEPGTPLTYRYDFQAFPNYATYIRSRGWGYHEVTTLDGRTVTIKASDEMRELHLDDV